MAKEKNMNQDAANDEVLEVFKRGHDCHSDTE